MCCEHLVCANCAQPVVEAGCPVCRVARAQVHRGQPPINVALVALIATALLAVAAVLYGHFAA